MIHLPVHEGSCAEVAARCAVLATRCAVFAARCAVLAARCAVLAARCAVYAAHRGAQVASDGGRGRVLVQSLQRQAGHTHGLAPPLLDPALVERPAADHGGVTHQQAVDSGSVSFQSSGA
jgi:hypothetical protein